MPELTPRFECHMTFIFAFTVVVQFLNAFASQSRKVNYNKRVLRRLVLPDIPQQAVWGMAYRKTVFCSYAL